MATAVRMAQEDQYRNRLQAQVLEQYLFEQPVSIPVLGLHNLCYWQPLSKRLADITRVMHELELCRQDMQMSNPLEMRIGAQQGELDWLEELHRLLHNYPAIPLR